MFTNDKRDDVEKLRQLLITYSRLKYPKIILIFKT